MRKAIPARVGRFCGETQKGCGSRWKTDSAQMAQSESDALFYVEQWVFLELMLYGSRYSLQLFHVEQLKVNCDKSTLNGDNWRLNCDFQ